MVRLQPLAGIARRREAAAAALGAALLITAAATAQAQQAPRPAQKPAQNAPAQQGQQQQAPEAQLAVSPNVPQPEWVKVCSTDPNTKKDVCLISRDIRAETGQTIASIALREVKGEPKRMMVIALPHGLLLQPGIRMVIDQKEPQAGRYSACFPNACYADIEAKDDMVANLKKGNNLIIQAMNLQAKTINFPVTLTGFSKAYDGAPLDPKVIAEEQQKLQDQLQRRAEEVRKRYIEQAGGGGAPGATPGAPASP